MSDKGKAHNVQQVVFESFGKGLQALSGILEQDRQNKLQDLQLQMNMQVQEARLENLRVSTAKNQEALNLMNETPEETGQRKAAEAIAETQDLLEGALLQRTGQPSIFPFATAFGGLQQTAEIQGIDFEVSTPTGDFEFGEQSITEGKTQLEVIESLFGEKGLRTALDPSKTGTGRPLSAKDQIVFDALGGDKKEFTEYLAGIGKYKRGNQELSVDEVLKIIEGLPSKEGRGKPSKQTLTSLKRQALVNVYGEAAVRKAEKTYGDFADAPFEDQEKLLKTTLEQ